MQSLPEHHPGFPLRHIFVRTPFVNNQPIFANENALHIDLEQTLEKFIIWLKHQKFNHKIESSVEKQNRTSNLNLETKKDWGVN